MERRERLARWRPAKLAAALVQLVNSAEPPARWAAGADAVGADAVGALEMKAKALLEQAGAHRELSSALAYNDQRHR